MKALYTLLYGVLLSVQPVIAADKDTQRIRLEVYRLQRQDSCVSLDMNLDLTEVHLAPDCTVYLYPYLKNKADSLMLPPVMLNGPQSDLMYRRRRALGLPGQMEKLPPYAVLREGDHPLPRINYRLNDIPYQQWTDSAELVLHPESYNNDARLASFSVQVYHIPPVTIERTDTLIVHDTIRITVDRPVYVEKKKETITEHAGYQANIYFPVSGMEILPEHELNRDSWQTFVDEIETIRSGGNNTIMGITVTGYSSPEGNHRTNDNIAERRALALKSFLESRYNSSVIEIQIARVAENWNDLAAMVRTSGMEDKDKVLEIIADTNNSETCKAKLKALSGGKTWEYMLREFFPKLRYASCRIGYIKKTEQ